MTDPLHLRLANGWTVTFWLAAPDILASIHSTDAGWIDGVNVRVTFPDFLGVDQVVKFLRIAAALEPPR